MILTSLESSIPTDLERSQADDGRPGGVAQPGDQCLATHTPSRQSLCRIAVVTKENGR